MDQKLKERLVGMAVLLFLGFIFIPIILDGQPSKVDVGQEIELPVPNGETSHVLDFKSGQVKKLELPKPVSTSADGVGPTENEQTSRPEPKNENTANEDKVVKETSTSTETQSGNSGLTTTNTLEKPVTVVQDEIERVAGDPSSAWVVQIGSFGDRNNAENEVKDLKEKGFPAFLSRYVNNKKAVLYRVRVGPEKDRSRAEKLAESLKKAGVNGQVVAHP